MTFIGITGGVGAGKTTVLSYLSKMDGVKVLVADEIAHSLMRPGTGCYGEICREFKDEDIFITAGEQNDKTGDLSKGVASQSDSMLTTQVGDTGRAIDVKAWSAPDMAALHIEFDRAKLASVIFSSDEKRARLNAIVHPAVREFVQDAADDERRRGETRLLVLEAALLLEEHYDEICDEIWYIDASEEVRKRRLVESRGYSEEKVRQIFKSQLPPEEYRRKCKVVIDNGGSEEETARQLTRELRALAARRGGI